MQLASELTPRTRFREGPQGREWDMVKGRSRVTLHRKMKEKKNERITEIKLGKNYTTDFLKLGSVMSDQL